VYFSGTSIVAGDTMHLWGAQVEDLPFASSYIPTTTTAVTRAADDLLIPFSGNAPRIDASHANEMTLILDADLYMGNNGQIYQHFLSSSLSHEYMVRVAPTGAQYMYAGNNDAIANNSTWIDNQTNRIAYVVNADNTGLGYQNGVFGGSGSVAADSIGNATTLYIGSWSYTWRMYGHIRNFRIYDKALTPAEIAVA